MMHDGAKGGQIGSGWRGELWPGLRLAALSGAALMGMVLGFERLSGVSVGGTWALGVMVAVVVLVISLLSMGMFRRVLGESKAEEVLRLPGRLAWLHVLSWSGGALLLGAWVFLFSRYQAELAMLALMAGLLTGMGAFLVALLTTPWAISQRWHGAMVQLAREGRGWGRAGGSIRRKMTLVLGSLVFVACGFAMFSSFAVQREIVAFYARSQGEGVAGRVEQRLEGTEGVVDCQELGDLVPAGGAIVWGGAHRGGAHRGGPTDRGGGHCVLGATLDVGAVQRALRSGGTRISEPSLDLEGAVFKVADESLVVFVPRPDWTKRLMALLSVFFSLLFLFSAWLAGMVSRSLTQGVLSLRHQVARMEAGDLSSSFEPDSPDEVGELAASMETMRRGVSEMVETIRSLNVTLEEKVRLRTEQLELANGELTAAMEKLTAAQAQLVHSEKMASLGRLLSGLAHELRNPVNAIVNNAEPLREKLGAIVERGSADEVTLQRLMRGAEVIENAGRRTVALLGSLGSLSRPEVAGAGPVVLAQVVSSALAIMAHRFETTGVQLEQILDWQCVVTGHEGELGQVVVNLVDNAIDACMGSPGGRVRVVVESRPGVAILAVWDNGPGVAQEDVSKLFEPFFTRKDHGTGLGLAIVDQIVARHSGRMEVVRSSGETGFIAHLVG